VHSDQGFVSRSLNSNPSRTLLVHHAAIRLGLSRRMVRHLAKSGVLRARKVGKKIWRFTAGDVARFQAHREAQRV
jgi:excisionase family DNA binding protein